MSSKTVTLKLEAENAQKGTGDVHAVVLTLPPTYAALEAAACNALNAGAVKLRYVDEDGDRIVLASQYDLDTALALAAPGTPLHVLAEVLSPLPQTEPEEPKKPEEPTEATPLETLLTQLTGIGGLEAALGGVLEHLTQSFAALQQEQQHEDAEQKQSPEVKEKEGAPKAETGAYEQVAHALPGTVVHWGVTCDGCGASPVRGMRYKCACCANYDLCQECVRTARARHGAQHVFVPLAVPVSGVQLAASMRAAAAAAGGTGEGDEVRVTPAEREAEQRLEEMGFTDVRRNLAHQRRFNCTICEQLVECLARLNAEDHK